MLAGTLLRGFRSPHGRGGCREGRGSRGPDGGSPFAHTRGQGATEGRAAGLLPEAGPGPHPSCGEMESHGAGGGLMCSKPAHYPFPALGRPHPAGAAASSGHLRGGPPALSPPLTFTQWPQGRLKLTSTLESPCIPRLWLRVASGHPPHTLAITPLPALRGLEPAEPPPEPSPTATWRPPPRPQSSSSTARAPHRPLTLTWAVSTPLSRTVPVEPSRHSGPSPPRRGPTCSRANRQSSAGAAGCVRDREVRAALPASDPQPAQQGLVRLPRGGRATPQAWAEASLFPWAEPTGAVLRTLSGGVASFLEGQPPGEQLHQALGPFSEAEGGRAGGGGVAAGRPERPTFRPLWPKVPRLLLQGLGEGRGSSWQPGWVRPDPTPEALSGRVHPTEGQTESQKHRDLGGVGFL